MIAPSRRREGLALDLARLQDALGQRREAGLLPQSHADVGSRPSSKP